MLRGQKRYGAKRCLAPASGVRGKRGAGKNQLALVVGRVARERRYDDYYATGGSVDLASSGIVKHLGKFLPAYLLCRTPLQHLRRTRRKPTRVRNRRTDEAELSRLLIAVDAGLRSTAVALRAPASRRCNKYANNRRAGQNHDGHSDKRPSPRHLPELYAQKTTSRRSKGRRATSRS